MDARSRSSGVGLFFVARQLFKAMRPVQWVKNVFVFAPLVFGLQLTHTPSLWAAASTFVLFSLISSAVYLLNDILDRESDARHPTKQFRPIASGALPLDIARISSVVAASVALIGAAFLDWRVAVVLLSYLLLNIAYSVRLKRWPFIDITCIAMGFLLRVLAGGFAIAVPVSVWLLMCTFLLASLLALGKRRHELMAVHRNGRTETTRAVLEHYRAEHIDWVMRILTVVTVSCYGAYTLAASTVAQFQTNSLVYSVAFVVLGLLRFHQLVGNHGEAQSPTDTMVRDAPFLVNVGAWAIFVTALIYFQW